VVKENSRGRRAAFDRSDPKFDALTWFVGRPTEKTADGSLVLRKSEAGNPTLCDGVATTAWLRSIWTPAPVSIVFVLRQYYKEDGDAPLVIWGSSLDILKRYFHEKETGVWSIIKNSASSNDRAPSAPGSRTAVSCLSCKPHMHVPPGPNPSIWIAANDHA
jgi:hypothetical protein